MITSADNAMIFTIVYIAIDDNANNGGPEVV